MLNRKAPMCNMSVNLKLDDHTLNFVFSNKQNRPFYMTSFEHLHSSFELHFIISGACRLRAANIDRTLCENTVVIIPPKEKHCITEFSEKCKKVDVRVTATFDDGAAASELPFNSHEITVVENCIKTVSYARDFFEAMSYAGRDGDAMTRSALTLMYFSLLRDLGLRTSDGRRTYDAPSLAYDHVIIEDFLMQNYMRHITLGEVAEATGFTSTHIGRVVKKNYGMSYSELILTMRMTHAKKLLDGGTGLTDIAKMLGYSSYNGFALAFKRYFRESPEAMRRRSSINTVNSK